MTFRIEVDKQPNKFIKKADDMLKANPVPHDAKRIVNRKETTFRIRVGNYRILYVVFYDKKYILVSKIDKRPRAY